MLVAAPVIEVSALSPIAMFPALVAVRGWALVLTIAFAPLVIPRFWHHHYGKFAFVWAVLALTPMAALHGVVLVLAVLVAGLLRSHADILKALHDLGVGVGEPGGDASVQASGDAAARSRGVPLTIGPPLPGERNSTSAPAIAGVTPAGAASRPGARKQLG